MSTVLRPNINRRSATQRPPTTASPTISRGLPSGGRPPSGLRSSSTVVDDRQAEDRRRLSSPIIVDWSIGHESGKKRWLQGLEPTTLGSQVKLLSHSAIVLILPILLVCAPFEAALADDSSTTRRRVDQQASAPRTSRASSARRSSTGLRASARRRSPDLATTADWSSGPKIIDWSSDPKIVEGGQRGTLGSRWAHHSTREPET